MLRAYFRLVLFVLAFAAAAVLFAFAFTAAAVVAFVIIVLFALFGRPPRVDVWTAHRDDHPENVDRRPPLTIDHDPNDLPDDKEPRH